MEKRSGIWVPLEIMKINNLDWENKILLTEILSLHQANHGCIASNQYFGSFLGITSGAASKRISKLIKSGYIKTENIYRNGRCIGRVIIPIKTKKKSGSVNNESGEQDDSSKEDQNVLPKRPEGTSLTTMGVVPEQPGSTSPGNTINTIIKTDREKEIEKQQEILNQSPEHTGPDCEVSDSNAEVIGVKLSLAEQRKHMNKWFKDYPEWESDLLRIGLAEFIEKTQNYHFNNQDYIGMIEEFYNT